MKNIYPIGKGTWENPDHANDDGDVLYDFDDPLGPIRKEIQKVGHPDMAPDLSHIGCRDEAKPDVEISSRLLAPGYRMTQKAREELPEH